MLGEGKVGFAEGKEGRRTVFIWGMRKPFLLYVEYNT